MDAVINILKCLIEQWKPCLATALLLRIWIWYGLQAQYDTHTGKRIPGPDNCFFGRSPLLALIHGRLDKKVSTVIRRDFLETLGDGSVCALRVFGLKLMIVQNAEMIKKVLTGKHDKFPKASRYTRLKVFLGEGLVTSSGMCLCIRLSPSPSLSISLSLSLSLSLFPTNLPS